MTTTLDAQEFPGASCSGSTPCCGRRSGSPTPRRRRTPGELVQAVLDLHGAGLERILTHLEEAGEAGRRDPRRLRRG